MDIGQQSGSHAPGPQRLAADGHGPVPCPGQVRWHCVHVVRGQRHQHDVSSLSGQLHVPLQGDEVERILEVGPCAHVVRHDGRGQRGLDPLRFFAALVSKPSVSNVTKAVIVPYGNGSMLQRSPVRTQLTEFLIEWIKSKEAAGNTSIWRRFGADHREWLEQANKDIALLSLQDGSADSSQKAAPLGNVAEEEAAQAKEKAAVRAVGFEDAVAAEAATVIAETEAAEKRSEAEAAKVEVVHAVETPSQAIPSESQRAAAFHASEEERNAAESKEEEEKAKVEAVQAEAVVPEARTVEEERTAAEAEAAEAAAQNEQRTADQEQTEEDEKAAREAHVDVGDDDALEEGNEDGEQIGRAQKRCRRTSKFDVKDIEDLSEE